VPRKEVKSEEREVISEGKKSYLLRNKSDLKEKVRYVEKEVDTKEKK
jgi:hypothetical protein